MKLVYVDLNKYISEGWKKTYKIIFLSLSFIIKYNPLSVAREKYSH